MCSIATKVKVWFGDKEFIQYTDQDHRHPLYIRVRELDIYDQDSPMSCVLVRISPELYMQITVHYQ